MAWQDETDGWPEIQPHQRAAIEALIHGEAFYDKTTGQPMSRSEVVQAVQHRGLRHQAHRVEKRVAFIDYEGSPLMLTERLAAMGVEIPEDHPLMQPLDHAVAYTTLAESILTDPPPTHPNRAQRRAARRHR